MQIPRGPPEDPTPVMHSPPRKVTVADQEAWKIPPSISNWKNAKGYTIPLDKRLAADGRGLQEVGEEEAQAGRQRRAGERGGDGERPRGAQDQQAEGEGSAQHEVTS